MKRIKQLLTPLALLVLTTTLSFGTVYSDGEDGTTTGWRVYDNSPSGAIIENIMDTDKNSNVIEFKGEKRKNAYMIGDKKNSKGWKNSTELTMKWSMNFSEKFKISIYLKTKKGNRVLYYDEKNSDKGFYKKKYIRLGLGSASKSGKWIDITRNLEADLQKHESSNYIKMVSGVKVQGSGKIDNLELIKSSGQPVGDLQISDIEVIKLKDDYAKVAWKLNHKANGQVEYGVTTNYGSFSKKADNFKFSQHRQSLRGLEVGTTYHYRVISEDVAGERAVSEDKTFTTTGGDGGGGADNPPITLEKLKEMIKNKEDVTKVNTSEITDMSYLFSWNESFNQDISGWDVSKVTNMRNMFEGAYRFNQNIDNWDVSNVECMLEMFKNTSFNQPLNNWNTSKVNDLRGMFSNNYKFNQPLNNWDMRNVESMREMFEYTPFNQDISDWIFNKIEYIDLSGTKLSIENYDKLLIAWSQKDFANKKITLKGLKYSSRAKEARAKLLNNWQIRDKGEDLNSKQLLISHMEVNKISQNHIEISWDLNKKGTGQVKYGESNNYGEKTKKESHFYKHHKQSLRNLKPNTTYHYRIFSESENGEIAISDDMLFSTKDINSEIYQLKKWSNQATLADGKKIEVTIQDHSSDRRDNKYTLSIKDITDTNNPSLLVQHEDEWNDFGDENIAKGGVIQVGDNGTRLYIMKNHPDVDGEIHSMIIYDISTPTKPIKMNENYIGIYIWNAHHKSTYITSSDHIHLLDKHNFLLRGSNGNYEHPCYDEKYYAKIIDVTDGNHPKLGEKYHYSSSEYKSFCDVLHFKINSDNSNHYIDIIRDDPDSNISREIIKYRVNLQGKPYTAFMEGNHIYATLGDKGVEIVNFKTNTSKTIIKTDIFAKYIVKISNSKFLILNDTEYQYITY